MEEDTVRVGVLKRGPRGGGGRVDVRRWGSRLGVDNGHRRDHGRSVRGGAVARAGAGSAAAPGARGAGIPGAASCGRTAIDLQRGERWAGGMSTPE